MAAKTRLGNAGYGVQRNGSFAGKTPSAAVASANSRHVYRLRTRLRARKRTV